MLDEFVSPPIGILDRGKQLLTPKDLVLHVSCHAVHLVLSDYHAFLDPSLVSNLMTASLE